MRTVTEKTVMHSYPGMVAIVTVHANGEDNIMAAGWHSYISMDPPLYGVAIGRERHTYKLIQEADSFAIQFLPFEKIDVIQQSGVYSGADTNKLHSQSFDRGIHTKAPILHDAYVAYEIVKKDVQTYGDHDWFVGEIVTSYRDESKFGPDRLPDFSSLSIPLYLGRSSYAKLDNGVTIQSAEVEKLSRNK